MSTIKTIYFAGKVSKGGGYRGELLGDDRVMSNGHTKYVLNGGSLIYGGPFALSCDHGCWHKQGSHGLASRDAVCGGQAEDLDECKWNHGFAYSVDSESAIQTCLSQIADSDAVHCFMDTISCYGTLFELGYATAIGKPIYIYYLEGQQNWDKHFWFTLKSPLVKHCGPGTATDIHPDLLTPTASSYRERYHEYLRSDEWDSRRKQKIREAGGRCQLCNAARPIQVHHRTYERVFHELPSDLIALCDNCHEKFHVTNQKG